MPRFRESLLVGAVWVCVVVGLGLRLELLYRNQSFWIDESMLALNVVPRSPAQLLEPLDWNQGAPVGYLLLVKYTTLAFGTSEWALRLVSFLAGVGAFLAFTHFAYRNLDRVAARFAVALFALSPYLIAYSAEFKQYELDAACCCVMLICISRAESVSDGLVTKKRDGSRCILTAIAGAIAVWLSHPVVFVLAGVVLASLYDAATRRDRAGIMWRLGMIAVWLVSFAVCYLMFTSKLGMNDYLKNYWAGTFMPFPPRSLGDFAWIAQHLIALFDQPAGFSSAAFGGSSLAVFAAVVGFVRLWQTSRPLAIALVLPILLALLASATGKYPFVGRLMMFTVPLLLTLVAVGGQLLLERLGTLHTTLPWCFVGLLFVSPTYQCYLNWKQPLHAEDGRGMVALLAQERKLSEPIFVSIGAIPSFTYYVQPTNIDPKHVTFSTAARGAAPSVYLNELQQFRRQDSLWVLLSHHQLRDEAIISTYLDSIATKDAEFVRPGAVLWRYRFKPDGANIPPMMAETPQPPGE